MPGHRALRIEFYDSPVEIKLARALGIVVRVPPQGRLTLKRARRPYRPDLEGPVLAAAHEHIAIGIEADRSHPVLGISQ